MSAKASSAQLPTGPVLSVANLAKSYGNREAVRGVSFEIRAGEVYGLLGPNGAGKTTTIGMIATVINPTRGEIHVAGLRTADQSEAVKRKLGLVPQQLGLYPALSAEENLSFFGAMYGLEGRRLQRRVDELLELTGLTSRRKEPVAIFSGGMKRRLNLACGLVHEPDLLLLDEPTVGVDPQSRERIFTAVEELAKGGMALLYTTHYMEEAERLCHRVAIMDEGLLIAEGRVEELAKLLGEGVSVAVAFRNAPPSTMLARLSELGARQAGANRFQLVADSAEELVACLLELASSQNTPIQELVVHRPNLGEVFLDLTGKELRD